MVGQNFRFGRGRAGGLEDLERLGGDAGFEVRPTELVGDDEGPWSSTRVRQLIASGDMRGAAEVLGRPHMVSGTVGKGDQRGRKLGFPTCNIADTEEALPPFGVYAVLIDRVVTEDDMPRARAMAKGVANLGVRPTIGGGDHPILEAHAFDFDEDVYGATLRVHLVERLREERRFDGLDALRSQIAADCAKARRTLDAFSHDADSAWF
jgi:riboflavin kinase/FMN adenylyltransferase